MADTSVSQPRSSASEIASSVQGYKSTSEALQALFGHGKTSTHMTGFNPSQLSEGRKTELRVKKRKGKKNSSAVSVSNSTIGTIASTSILESKPSKISGQRAAYVPYTACINPPRLICPKPSADSEAQVTCSSSAGQDGREPEATGTKCKCGLHA